MKTFSDKSFRTCSNEAVNLRQQDEKKQKCTTCSADFKIKSRLDRHYKTHYNEKRFGCDLCDKKFKTKYNLTTHLKTHAYEECYKCSSCEKTFKSIITLCNHSKRHAKADTKQSCAFCEKRFWNTSELERHLRIHTGEKPFKCRTCGLAFAQKFRLNDHQKIHTGVMQKRFPCTICNARYTRPYSLREHIKTIHILAKSVICGECGKAFRTRSNLAKHQKRLHLNNSEFRKYYCVFCAPTRDEFCTKWELFAHLFSHIREQPFSCKICGSSFSQGSHLKGHMIIHDK